MKTFSFLAVITLLATLSFSCQKEEVMIKADSDTSIFQTGQLKNGTDEIGQIDALISKIEVYMDEDVIDPGIGNSLLSKLKNARKSFEKGNENAGMNQLIALINQLEDLVAWETIDPMTGEELIVNVQQITGTGWLCGDPIWVERDNKNYNTVQIGGQCWMAENLAYLPSVSPSALGSYHDPYYYVYGYEDKDANVTDAKATENYSKYGVLYNWFAATDVDPCPDGWHLPDDGEWTTLTDYLGGIGGAGILMKSATGWDDSGNGTNTSGFSALPGGYRESNPGTDNFVEGGSEADFWTSTSVSTYSAITRVLRSSEDGVLIGNPTDKHRGFSIRCVKN